MEHKHGVYYLPCEINSLKLKFVFDTGASDCSISLAEAIFMLKNGYLNESDLLGSTYSRIANGEVVEGTKIILKTVKIGDKTIYGVQASIVHSLSAPLLLGQSAIKQLGKFQFDYATSSLTIGDVNMNSAAANKNINNTNIHEHNFVSYAKIREKKVTQYFVTKILGKPMRKTTYSDTSETWYYYDDLIYFENGYVYEYENYDRRLDRLLALIK